MELQKSGQHHKTMNKKENNSFVTLLSALVSQFVPHIFLMQQHNPVKEGKNYRLIFNTVEQPVMDSIPINLMTSTKIGTKHYWTYGSWLTTLSTYGTCTSTLPNQDILMYVNDVKSCYQQLKHYLDIIDFISFVINKILFLHGGLIFGSNFCTANWEPINHIVEQLATVLFNL